ncbi:MAG: PAS domain S-box protein [Candidatus Tantalella remota]|nr:PAS domain S-box protein [Candidatus Tantalella remota]
MRRLIDGAKIMSSGNLDFRVDIASRDEAGEVAKIFDKMADDLTDAQISHETLSREVVLHKKTLDELKKSEEHFRILFEHSNDAVFLYDFDGEMIEVNHKACDMLGYSVSELLRIPFVELNIEEEKTKSKEAIKTGTGKYALRYESKFRTAEGKVIDVEISSSAVDLKKGIMQGIVRNITEHKELERALRESEEKFRTFMETASDLMFIADAQGRLNYVNESMANTLGYDKKELLGKDFTMVLHHSAKEDFSANHRRLIIKGEAKYETVWETKNRKKLFGEIEVGGIYTEKGVFAGARGIFRDITERKKVEESQRLAQLGKLAADVAHEVNSPVSVISARAEMSMLKDAKEGDVLNNLKIIVDQCGQATSIVKRLLMFSKPSRGEFTEVDITETMDFILELLSQQFTIAGVKAIKDFDPEVPRIKVDEKQIQEVFMNLLRNAIEAMGDVDNATVTISIKQAGENMKLDIIDTGEGITEDDMKRIFDPFFTTKTHGTGLGLSVCYGILKIHKGDLKYTSSPGEGTTATVLLPIDPGSA